MPHADLYGIGLEGLPHPESRKTFLLMARGGTRRWPAPRRSLLLAVAEPASNHLALGKRLAAKGEEGCSAIGSSWASSRSYASLHQLR